MLPPYYAAVVVRYLGIMINRALIASAFVTLILLQSTVFADPIHKAPELIGKPSDWLNTDGKALHLYGPGGLLEPGADGKKHHIVLIDFWEYTCVNCIRTLPYVKAWDAEYRDDGLVVIGIHSPEFAFAHDEANVRAAVARLGIRYPVVNDSAYNNWNAWKNDVWPREILIDADGNVLEDNEGEGGYAQTEAKIRAALKQVHPEGISDSRTVRAEQAPSSSTDEMYCGYDRGADNYAGAIKKDAPSLYQNGNPAGLGDGSIALSGTWKVTAESVRHVGNSGRDYVEIRYHGPDCNAVIKPETGQPCDVVIRQDGQPIRKADAGDDIKYDADGRSYLHVDQPRMYAITRLAHPGAHDLALQPVSKGFGLYSFAF